MAENDGLLAGLEGAPRAAARCIALAERHARLMAAAPDFGPIAARSAQSAVEAMAATMDAWAADLDAWAALIAARDAEQQAGIARLRATLRRHLPDTPAEVVDAILAESLGADATDDAEPAQAVADAAPEPRVEVAISPEPVAAPVQVAMDAPGVQADAPVDALALDAEDAVVVSIDAETDVQDEAASEDAIDDALEAIEQALDGLDAADDGVEAILDAADVRPLTSEDVDEIEAEIEAEAEAEADPEDAAEATPFAADKPLTADDVDEIEQAPEADEVFEAPAPLIAEADDDDNDDVGDDTADPEDAFAAPLLDVADEPEADADDAFAAPTPLIDEGDEADEVEADEVAAPAPLIDEADDADEAEADVFAAPAPLIDEADDADEAEADVFVAPTPLLDPDEADDAPAFEAPVPLIDEDDGDDEDEADDDADVIFEAPTPLFGGPETDDADGSVDEPLQDAPPQEAPLPDELVADALVQDVHLDAAPAAVFEADAPALDEAHTVEPAPMAPVEDADDDALEDASVAIAAIGLAPIGLEAGDPAHSEAHSTIEAPDAADQTLEPAELIDPGPATIDEPAPQPDEVADEQAADDPDVVEMDDIGAAFDFSLDDVDEPDQIEAVEQPEPDFDFDAPANDDLSTLQSKDILAGVLDDAPPVAEASTAEPPAIEPPAIEPPAEAIAQADEDAEAPDVSMGSLGLMETSALSTDEVRAQLVRIRAERKAAVVDAETDPPPPAPPALVEEPAPMLEAAPQPPASAGWADAESPDEPEGLAAPALVEVDSGPIAVLDVRELLGEPPSEHSRIDAAVRAALADPVHEPAPTTALDDPDDWLEATPTSVPPALHGQAPSQPAPATDDLDKTMALKPIDLSAAMEAVVDESAWLDASQSTEQLTSNQSLESLAIDDSVETADPWAELDISAHGDLKAGRASVSRAPRAQVEMNVGVEHKGNFFTAYTADISSAGMFVRSDQALAVGARVDLFFELPDSQSIAVQAEVSWSKAGSGGGMGLKFIGLRYDDRVAIDRYVTAQTR